MLRASPTRYLFDHLPYNYRMSLTPQALATIRLFAGLTSSQMDWISARLRNRDFPPATDLMIEGEPGGVVIFCSPGRSRFTCRSWTAAR